MNAPVTYAKRRQLEAKTRLGPVLVEVPGDWLGSPVPDADGGGWMFEDEQNTCTLYVQAEKLTATPAKQGPEYMARLVKSIVDYQGNAFPGHTWAVDEADRGIVYRARYGGSDRYGDIWNFERTRYIDLDGHTILKVRFLFVCDASLQDTDAVTELVAESVFQFDFVTGQVARRHGFDLDRDPTILWRMTELDMGVGTFRFCKPLEMSLHRGAGHDENSYLWTGHSLDDRWILNFERSSGRSDEMMLDEVCAHIQDLMLETARTLLPLKAAPVIEEIGAHRIIEVLFGSPHDAHDHVRRWYVIVQYTDHVRLHRITFGCRGQEVEMKPIRALTQFCRDWADDLVGIYEPVSDETREKD